MVKTRIILVVVTALLIIILFQFPKVVVSNEEKPLSSDSLSTKPSGNVADVHTRPASVQLLSRIGQLKSKYRADTKNEKNAIFADSLASLYSEAERFDSAAWFAEEAATFFNTPGSWIKAGDLYYKAYTFAMDQSKQAQWAEKTRSFYTKVLGANSKNLDVKTKMAMTYLSSSNPMQGILMLREVLADDPQNQEALFNLGMLSIQSGQYQRAVERLEELIRLNPAHVQGQLLLGIALMNDGKKERAKQQFEKVKQLDKDPAVQATADSYLKDLK